jgi:hypothetical protein
MKITHDIIECSYYTGPVTHASVIFKPFGLSDHGDGAPVAVAQFKRAIASTSDEHVINTVLQVLQTKLNQIDSKTNMSNLLLFVVVVV